VLTPVLYVAFLTLDETAAAKVAAKARKQANERVREQRAADKKVKDAAAAMTKRAKVDVNEEEMRREAWVDIGSEVSHEAGCRLRMMGLALPIESVGTSGVGINCGCNVSRRRTSDVPTSYPPSASASVQMTVDTI